MPGKPKRGDVTPPANGKTRATINIGGMMGAGGVDGGPGASAGMGTGDDSGGAGNEAASDSFTPATVNTSPAPYTVKHPILDYIFNQGQGHMAANQANMANQNFSFQSSVQQANAMKLQKDNQAFELTKQQIAYDNSLSEAAKASAIRQIEAQQAQHNAVATQNNIMIDPASTQAYMDNVNPVAINASESGVAFRDASNKGGAITQGAKNDAAASTYPTMVNTEKNNIFAGNVASQGAVQNAPLKNAAENFELKMRPTQIRTEVNKAPIISTGAGLYNVNTGTVPFRSPIQDMQASMLGSLNFGGNTGRVSTLPSGLGTAPQSAARTIFPAASSTALPIGAYRLPDGSILNADGSITPAGQ